MPNGPHGALHPWLLAQPYDLIEFGALDPGELAVKGRVRVPFPLQSLPPLHVPAVLHRETQCNVAHPRGERDLLVPELRRRGLYPDPQPEGERLTAREKIYGRGQSGLRDDHIGSKYKYDVYVEEPPYVQEPLNVEQPPKVEKLPNVEEPQNVAKDKTEANGAAPA